MNNVIDKPVGNIEILGVNLNSATAKYCVKAENNNIATFDDVILVFLEDCKYDEATAIMYTKKIHHEGSAVCFFGKKDDCDRIVNAFSRIKVTAKTLEI